MPRDEDPEYADLRGVGRGTAESLDRPGARWGVPRAAGELNIAHYQDGRKETNVKSIT